MLAFVREPRFSFGSYGEIYVKMLPEGEPTRLTNDGTPKLAPAFSTDGSKIAYGTYGNWQTIVVPVLGGQPRPLLSNATGLSWIDPQHVMFSEVKKGWHFAIVTATESRADERDIYVPPRETDMAHYAWLSPDGKWVLVAEMREGGWYPCRLVPFAGPPTAKPIGPQDGDCDSAAWSPDGKWMYFSSNANRSGYHIWRQEFPDGQPERITSGPNDEEGIAVAPDGKSLITSVGNSQETVWLRDEKGDRQISTNGYATFAMFAPGGAKLFYLMGPQSGSDISQGKGELWVTDLKSGTSENVMPGFGVRSYSISPDGKTIAFSTGSEKDRQILVASLDHRSSPRQLVASGKSPVYGRSGAIYYVASEGAANFLFRIKVDGSVPEKISPDPVVMLTDISPDESYAEVLRPIQDESYSVAHVAIPLNGGAAVRLCYENCALAWAQDGSAAFFYFASMDSPSGAKTFVIPLKKGQVLPKLPSAGAKTPADLPDSAHLQVINERVSDAASPSLYAFTRRTVQRNLYRIPIH
jgi:Tol biopolymer transport system component